MNESVAVWDKPPGDQSILRSIDTYSISLLQIDIQLVFQATAIVHVYLPAHLVTKIFKLNYNERERERESQILGCD